MRSIDSRKFLRRTKFTFLIDFYGPMVLLASYRRNSTLIRGSDLKVWSLSSLE